MVRKKRPVAQAESALIRPHVTDCLPEKGASRASSIPCQSMEPSSGSLGKRWLSAVNPVARTGRDPPELRASLMTVNSPNGIGICRHALLALRLGTALCLCYLWVSAAPAQESLAASGEQNPQVDTPATPQDDPQTIMFPHAEWDRWWLSGQANFISQWHPNFH